jgi:hypothetical protein
MQFARDIRDGRFLKPDLTEQTFRDLDNQLVSVFLLRSLPFPHMEFKASFGLFYSA